jgi:hypothetical protein
MKEAGAARGCVCLLKKNLNKREGETTVGLVDPQVVRQGKGDGEF